jgi:regulator of protease activity HflC (stomatin/prohibitin superfamily)
MKTHSVIAFVIAVIVAAVAQNYFAGIVAFIGVSIFANKMPDEFQKIIDEVKKAIEQAKQGQQKFKTAIQNKPSQPSQSANVSQSKTAPESKHHMPQMLKNRTDSSGRTHTDNVSMKSTLPALIATVIEQPRKEIPMFAKMIVAVVLAAAAGFMTQSPGAAIGVFLAAFFIALIIEGVRIVPQQNAWVVERLGKFHLALQPGFNLIVPFIDRVAYRHSLKEVPLDVQEQVCITKDNTQLAVDGIIYFQVVDPRLASYGTSDYELAISQLAQTALRSEVGKMELDKTFESRDEINHKVVSVLDEAGRTWGIKVLRYEIKSLTPPESILRSMQAQITAEREKRALIAKSEGVRQEEINIADGQRQASILASEGQKQAAINKAQGEALALTTVAEATASAVRQVAAALSAEGGMQAANLKVAEKYIEQFGNLAKVGNTLILPANLADAGGFVAAAMTVLDKAKLGQLPK